MTDPAERAPLAPTSLPWLAPSAASLVALCRPEGNIWPEVRDDPAAVLLLVRFSHPDGRLPFPVDALFSAAPLRFARARLEGPPSGTIDSSLPGPAQVFCAAAVLARIARALACRRSDVDPDRAWCCGLLAPLGWFALCATAPDGVTGYFVDPTRARSPRAALERHHLPDPALVASRVARSWRLPDWLASVLSELDLPLAHQTGQGRPAVLVALTRLAASLAGDLGHDLGLCDDAGLAEAERLLGWQRRAFRGEELAGAAPANSSPPQCPYGVALLPQLLGTAAANRDLLQSAEVARLQADVDALHVSLREQTRGEHQRLREAKLAALAELAAGAGHEINNPLAVISGQAQYLLSHGDWLAGEHQGEARQALHTVIGQTKRIHSLLRDLMQFARPAQARPETVDLPTLLGEVAAGLREMADSRRVRVEVVARPERLGVVVDREQVRVALANLLRNAIEAAGPEGWARLTLTVPPRTDTVEVLVEDSGPGPTAEQGPHLFDPFYSGRSAGRGRGLGLPVAWRLVRNQGGDVYVAPRRADEPTRFVLVLPYEAPAEEMGRAA